MPNSPLTPEWFAEQREICNKATRGDRDSGGLSVTCAGRGVIAACPNPQHSGVFECCDNAFFIAAARTEIPRLIATIEEARSDPPAHGEYRVVGGGGQDLTRPGLDLHELARKPPRR